MDDEIACESGCSRLYLQYCYLKCHPHIHIVGTQALITYDTLTGEDGRVSCDVDGKCRLLRMPCHPAHVSWEMLLRCVIIHPTVMFRRATVLECGGYVGASVSLPGALSTQPPEAVHLYSCEGIECIEDYYLWIRVLDRYCTSTVLAL